MIEVSGQVSAVKKWIVAARPWALPASTMPVIFGTSLAVVIGKASLDGVRFLLAFLAMVILHTAANMRSDVFDFKRGLDRDVTPVSGAIVRGWLSPKAVAAGASVLFVVGTAIGLILVWMTGPALLVVGVIGMAIGVFYPTLKYHALGDLAVFLNFGILGSLGAWIVQAGRFSWIPVIWTIPMAMLVSAILHANNWRDSVSDAERKITTMALLLKDRGALFYYGFLIFGPFGLVFALALIPRLVSDSLKSMPLTFVIVLLALPQAIKLWRRAVRRHAPRHPLDFVVLDGATSQFNLVFGLLCTAALWLRFILNLFV
ncbi:MAG: prenyltransferase [Candidatus Aminicenantales bacterium]